MELLITVAGSDNPELLKDFGEAIALIEGVCLDCQQTIIAGQLIAIYKVQLPHNHLQLAHQLFEQFTEAGLHVLSVKQLAQRETGLPDFSLDLSGPYRVGLEQEVRMILESHGIEIARLNHAFLGQSLIDDMPFYLHIRANMRRAISEPNLSKALHRLASGLTIEIRTLDAPDQLAS